MESTQMFIFLLLMAGKKLTTDLIKQPILKMNVI